MCQNARNNQTLLAQLIANTKQEVSGFSSPKIETLHLPTIIKLISQTKLPTCETPVQDVSHQTPADNQYAQRCGELCDAAEPEIEDTGEEIPDGQRLQRL